MIDCLEKKKRLSGEEEAEDPPGLPDLGGQVRGAGRLRVEARPELGSCVLGAQLRDKQH